MSCTLSIYNEIAWDFSDEYTDDILSGINSNKIFDTIKKVDKLPLANTTIYFSHDEWDFTKAVNIQVPQRKSIYKFSTIPQIYKEQIKFFILTQLWRGSYKIQSIYNQLYKIARFVSFLYDNNIITIELVSLKTIITFFEQLDELEPSTIKSYKHIILDFFRFYDLNYKSFEYVDISKYLSNNNREELLAQRTANKWETIPEDYFIRLLSCLIKVMNNDSLPVDDRGIASLLIIFSQTGLRKSELTCCKINSLKATSILQGTKTAYYLDYDTIKPTRGNNKAMHVYTAINELSYKAYNVLDNIYATQRARRNSELLFTPLKALSLPVTENTVDRMLIRFLLIYGNEVGCINVADKYPGLKCQPIDVLIDRNVAPLHILQQYKRTDILSYPRIHQYRVHLCSELYKKQVPLTYIQQFMAHLTKEMTSYYIRPEKDIEKEKEYAKSVMEMVVTNKVNLLGDNKDALMKSINNFISKNHYNVEKDLSTIIEKLTRKYPIRAKSGGICIKSGPVKDCRHNDFTDELYCAYGICPNNYHAFFMIDQTYNKFIELKKIIDYNSKNGFVKATEKETNKLKWLINKFLLPEFDELKSEINKNGTDKIIRFYPAIKWHAENTIIIEEEINKWIK